MQIWTSLELFFITDTDFDLSGINFVIISVRMVHDGSRASALLALSSS